MDFFEQLDQDGGFFYERWGDAPVHSIAAGLLLKKDEIHFFDDIAYWHVPFTHCPTSEQKRLDNKCHCNPKDNFDWKGYSCKLLNMSNMLTTVLTSNRYNEVLRHEQVRETGRLRETERLGFSFHSIDRLSCISTVSGVATMGDLPESLIVMKRLTERDNVVRMFGAYKQFWIHIGSIWSWRTIFSIDVR